MAPSAHQIGRTSGTGESAIHALMMAEAAVPTMFGLFCEVDAGVLAAAAAAVGVHEATVYADVAFAQPRRRVSPGERQVHSLLEVAPMAAATLLAVLHWDQAAALAGRGHDRADLRVRPKRYPLSARSRMAVLGAVGLFCALPYAEEFVRCPRGRPDGGYAPRPGHSQWYGGVGRRPRPSLGFFAVWFPTAQARQARRNVPV